MSDDVARYILAKKIARGGMAEIFLGKHVGEDGFQRLCAIKRILPHYAQDQEFIQMFRDEAHICKRLQHANIVRVEGFEEVEGSYAIIMEFVDGADLRTLLHAVEQSKKKMPIPMACYIIAEAARGLHFAHTKVDEITQQPLGIVHRDISPQNLLLSYEGEVKVTDFGIADAESKLTETRPGIVKGKYSYMSPEQISAKQVDARTDVFALTIVLWEMLTMRRLFQGENEVDTIQRVKNCRIDFDLRQLNPECDADIDEILKKGLAKDLKKRYKSAGDFEKDLRRYMSKRFPDFTPEDLGNYLKKALESRRTESAADIKKTLTETNLKPTAKKGLARGLAGGAKDGKRVELDVDGGKDQPAIPLVVKGAGTTGMNSQASVRLSPGPSSVSNMPSRVASSGNFSKMGRTGSTNASQPLPRGVVTTAGPSAAKIWLVAAMALLSLGVGLKLVMDPPATVSTLTLRTQPSRVKVWIDDKPVNRGRYLRASAKSPLRINLKPGSHELTVRRPGYKTYTWNFKVDKGEKAVRDDVVLNELSPVAAVRVKARGADGPVKFDIADGYFVATLIPGKAPTANPDLFAGKTYSMKVSTPSASFTCKVTAKSTNWRAPNEVTIDVKAKKCTMSGP